MEISNVVKYRNYLKDADLRSQFTVFSFPEWLDAEYGEGNWDVIIIESNNILLASFPFQRPHGIFKKSGMPLLAQTLGPWINKEELEKSKSEISRYYNLITELISELPKSHYFLQQLSPQLANHLPFYWAGYKQTTLYTYRLNFDGTFKGFCRNVKSKKLREFRKSSEDLELVINPNTEMVYTEYRNYLESSGKIIQYSKRYFINLIEMSLNHNFGLLLGAKHSSGSFAAFLWVAFDTTTAYHMITPINPKLKRTKALNYLIFQAIQHIPNTIKCYDFEGSMDQRIEKSFREFGALPIPYLRVRKTGPRWLSSLIEILKPL